MAICIQLSYIIFDTEVNEVVHTFDSVIKLETGRDK